MDGMGWSAPSSWHISVPRIKQREMRRSETLTGGQHSAHCWRWPRKTGVATGQAGGRTREAESHRVPPAGLQMWGSLFLGFEENKCPDTDEGPNIKGHFQRNKYWL